MKNTFESAMVACLSKEKNYSIIEIQGINNAPNVWCAKNIIDGKETYLMFLERVNMENALFYRNVIMHNVDTPDVDINLVVVTSSDKELNNEIKAVVDKGFGGGIFTVTFNGAVYRMNSGSKFIYDDLNYACKKILKSEKGIGKVFENIKTNKATTAFVVINVLMYIISAVISKSILDIDVGTLVTLGANNKLLVIDNGQYQRIISSMFLHGGLMHILFNMYALCVMGPLIEKIYGSLNFIGIYVVGGITSSLLSLALSESNVISVGASGAIFALLGAALVYGIKMRGTIGKQFMSSILQVIAINVFIGLSMPNIDNYAHLGGFAGGLLIAVIFTFVKK